VPRIYSRRVFVKGETRSGNFSVPVGVTRFRLRLSRDDWPDIDKEGAEGEVIYAEIQFSFDGGETWPMGRGIGSHGGQHFTLQGALLPEISTAERVPQRNNPNRRIRVRIRTRKDINSQVNVDLA